MPEPETAALDLTCAECCSRRSTAVAAFAMP